MSDSISLAVIGCGAIAESYYCPVLAADPSLRRNIWLVDPSLSRVKALAAKFGFDEAKTATDIADVTAPLGAAINATPSHIHVPTTLPLIERAIPILVEKPFAEFADDARRLLAAAEGRSVLAVNQFRRLAPTYALAREQIASGRLGEITAITWSEGHKFDWPSQSGFNFRRAWAHGRPRGSMLDIGAHVVDMVCWWLGERPVVESASLDGFGGPEAVGSVILRASTARVEITIGFLEKLTNKFLIEGTKGSLRGATADYDRLEFRPAGGSWSALKVAEYGDMDTIAKKVVDNLVAVATKGAQPLIPAASVLPAIETIDAIYEKAQSPLPSYYREWVA